MTLNEKKFIEKMRKRVGKAINRYGLIKENDSVMIALSGGKDSLSLLEILAFRRKYLPIEYDLSALHINVRGLNDSVDKDYLSKFCKERKVNFYYEKIEIDLENIVNKSPCFICSWNRRKHLFNKMKELGCNRLAMGHNMDDVLETLLMNMVFQGSISSMPPKLSMFGGEFDIIRPLTLLSEKDLFFYSKYNGFNEQKVSCLYGNGTKREEMKKVIKHLQKMNRRAKKSLFNSMSNIQEMYLPVEDS